MTSLNTKQIKIWKQAHEWLGHLNALYKANGISSMSMTAMASNAILSIPEPNGNGHTPDQEPCEEGIQVDQGDIK
jgi:hypothetical protein